jgi:hypothetical protein
MGNRKVRREMEIFLAALDVRNFCCVQYGERTGTQAIDFTINCNVRFVAAVACPGWATAEVAK